MMKSKQRNRGVISRRVGKVGGARLEVLESRLLMSAAVAGEAGGRGSYAFVPWGNYGGEAVVGNYAIQVGKGVDFGAFAAKWNLAVTEIQSLGGDGYYSFWSQLPSREIEKWGEQFRGEIVALEPNWVMTYDKVPNKISGAAWAVENYGQTVGNSPAGTAGADVKVRNAWNTTTGSSGVVVAVLDSGFQLNHPGLSGKFSPDGYDFGPAVPDADPSPEPNVADNEHGTEVAGVIAGSPFAVTGGSVYLNGMSPGVTILPLKVADLTGVPTVNASIKALDYILTKKAGGMNVSVVNMSISFLNDFAGTNISTFYNKVKDVGNAGVLLVASAGNGSENNDGSLIGTIKDPGFDIKNGSWSTNGTTAYVNPADSGVYTAKVSGVNSEFYQTIKVLAGASYTISGLGKADSGESAQLIVDGLASITFNTTGYTQGKQTFATGATQTSITVRFKKASGGGDAYAEDLQLFVHPVIQNANFNTTGSASTWTTVGTTAYVPSGPSAFYGQVSGVASEFYQDIPVIPNMQYSLSGWTIVGSGSDTAAIIADGATTVSAPVTSTGWVQTHLNFTAGTSQTVARIHFKKMTGSGTAMVNDFLTSTLVPRQYNYPASYGFASALGSANALANVISVAATTNGDKLAGFSNYGAQSVHVAAPGVDILTATLGSQGVLVDGTSMSAPIVAGIAALAASSRSVVGTQAAATAGELKRAIVMGVDMLSSLIGKTATSGRVNAEKAIAGIHNWGFEASTDLSMWSTSTSGETWVAGVPHSGAICGQLGTPDGSGNSANSDLYQWITGLQPNTTYEVAFWSARSGSTGAGATLEVRDYGGVSLVKAFNNTGYAKTTMLFTTGASNTSVKLVFFRGAQSGSGYVDDITVKEAGPTYNWGFEGGATVWSATAASNDSTGALEGVYRAKVQAVSTMTQTITGLQPNTTYKVSVAGLIDPVSGSANIYISGYNGALTDVKYFNTTSWVSQSITFTTGASNTLVNISLGSSVTAGNYSYFDDFYLVQV